ncbi:MAG: hypothetical protein ACJZ6A_01795 [Candidatus Poseidoniaceae archaeon]
MVDLPNLVASAIENERSGFTTAVLLSNNSRTIMKIRDVLPTKMRLKTITSSNKVSENLKDSNIDVEVLEESSVSPRPLNFEQPSRYYSPRLGRRPI